MDQKYVLLIDDRIPSSTMAQQPGDADQRSARGPTGFCKSLVVVLVVDVDVVVRFLCIFQ